MNDDERNQCVNDAFRELDGALCLWARAKGETPLKQYLHEVTPTVRRVLIGDMVFIITPAKDE